MTRVSRRRFIKSGTLTAFGISVLPQSVNMLQKGRAIGANDRIMIGIIGCGDRGCNAHMEGVNQHAAVMNLEIVAVADPWRIAREQANAKVKKWFGRDARQFVSYRDMLAIKELDAVMIASPDHVHTLHLEAAARAGKHIYVEKPLAMEMDKLVGAVNAVKKAGTVVQVGTQVRSFPGIVGSRDLFRSGTFGKLSRVEECRNSEQPYWYRYLKDIRQEDVDWKEFLSDRPMQPFSAEKYSGWYGYADFTHGPISGLGAHFIDLVHFITGAKFPESCVCLGGTFTWNDEHRFTAPDCVQATWIYPEGFLVSSSNNLGHGMGSVRRFYGDKGMLIADNWSTPTYSDRGSPRRDGTIKGENPVPLVERPDHFLDWFQCIRTGNIPHAPIEAGYQHAVAVLMAAESYKTGCKVVYDNKNRVIRKL
jgi:predicted dehydrogenase